MTQIQFLSFFSKTAGLIETKWHVESLWDGWLEVCVWDLGHMTKISAILIYGKNPLKIFFLGLNGQWPWTLMCNIGDSGPTKFVQLEMPHRSAHIW